METKRIGLFMKSLSNADFIYLEHCVGLRRSFTSLTEKYKLTKERFDILKNYNFTDQMIIFYELHNLYKIENKQALQTILQLLRSYTIKEEEV